MKWPGFTGEASLYKTSGQYRAMAGTPSGPVVAALTRGIFHTPKPDVDCTTFPDNQTCRECGPWGDFDCCQWVRTPDCTIKKPRPSLYQSSAHYQVSPTSAGLRQGGELLIQPALRSLGDWGDEFGCVCGGGACCCSLPFLTCCCFETPKGRKCFCI